MLILKALLIPYMAVLSRAHGGGKPHLPLSLDAWLLAAPYLLLYPLIGLWVVPSFFVAVLFIRTGHGSFFHYDRPHKEGRTVEKIEYIMPKGLSVYWYKVLGMFLTGLGVTLVASIALALHGHWIFALILALSGAAKSIAYFLPRTEWAEYARGSFLALGLIIVL
jgi:uncharacterized membrane protein